MEKEIPWKEPSISDGTSEETFQLYMSDLRLTPEDFNKKILDVGAGSAGFAKWAREHGVSNEIYSLEPVKEYLSENRKSVAGSAEKMPFDDESFDLVVSDAAIPNVYIGDDTDILREKVTGSLREMLRVVKTDGEIRLARVLLGKEYALQRSLSRSFEEALGDLEGKGRIQVEKIRTQSDDTYECDEKHNPVKLLAEAYLIIIRKNG